MTEQLPDVMLDATEIVTGYGRAEIVHGISLGARMGQVTCIIGPNGAGKSTLMKAMAGCLPIYSGRLSLGGSDITRLSQDARTRLGVGYVPQTKDVFPSLTVLENLAMGGYMCRRPELARRREEILDRFPQLRTVLRSRASSLSGGERKLVAIGRVLMSRPTVLLLDEPTAGLSPQYVGIVKEHILQVARDGQCVVVVEQHAIDALEIANQALVLVGGRIHYQSEARDLLANEDLGQMFLGSK